MTFYKKSLIAYQSCTKKTIVQDHSVRQNGHILFYSYLKGWASDDDCYFLKRVYVSDISESTENHPKYLKGAKAPSHYQLKNDQFL